MALKRRPRSACNRRPRSLKYALRHENPKIKLLTARLTQLRSGEVQRALACYEYVAGLPFRAVPHASTRTSIDVIEAGAGNANTKSTLFVALLRSIGIPARVRVVALRPDYLRGIIGTEAEPQVHAISEVLVGGAWLCVDSYSVDTQLSLAARKRLLVEGRLAGYGVHLRGQVGWDGTTSSFGHFDTRDCTSMPVLDYGVFHDIEQFCKAGAQQLFPGWAEIQYGSIAAAIANCRLNRLRAASKRPRTSP